MLDVKNRYDLALRVIRGEGHIVFYPQDLDAILSPKLRVFITSKVGDNRGYMTRTANVHNVATRNLYRSVYIGTIFGVTAFIKDDDTLMTEHEAKARRAVLVAVLTAFERGLLGLDLLVPHMQKWILNNSELEVDDESLVKLASNKEVVSVSPDDLASALKYLESVVEGM